MPKSEDVMGFYAMGTGLNQKEAITDLLASLTEGKPLARFYRSLRYRRLGLQVPAPSDDDDDETPVASAAREAKILTDSTLIAKALANRSGYTVADLRAESLLQAQVACAKDVIAVMFEPSDPVCCNWDKKGPAGLGEARSAKQWMECRRLDQRQFFSLQPTQTLSGIG